MVACGSYRTAYLYTGINFILAAAFIISGFFATTQVAAFMMKSFNRVQVLKNISITHSQMPSMPSEIYITCRISRVFIRF